MYILKQIPEDFVVKEITNFQSDTLQPRGRYAYYKLRKKNLNTLDSVRIVARVTGKRDKQIGFAGTKDKHAITEQTISIEMPAKKEINTKNEDLELTFLGYNNNPISLGSLEGNYFEIVVRNLNDNTKIEKINYSTNYFDEQRFSKHNVEIGRFLVKKNFEEALRLIDSPQPRQHLQKHSNDYVGALKKLPKRLLRLYLNAYQSYLWNETLAEFLRENSKDDNEIKEINYSQGKLVFVADSENFLDLEISLIGFASDELEENNKIKNIISNLMQKEDLDYTDFVIKQIPELSMEGGLRKAFVNIKDLHISKPEDDELNKDRKKIKLTFSLNKGSYATMVVKQIFN